jgi:hypothetical protein
LIVLRQKTIGAGKESYLFLFQGFLSYGDKIGATPPLVAGTFGAIRGSNRAISAASGDAEQVEEQRP